MDTYLEPNANFKRLWEEYKKYGNLIICLDFDDTVYNFHNIYGRDYGMVVALVKRLRRIGCKIIIWTGNKDLKLVNSTLEKLGIQYDVINEDLLLNKSRGESPRKVYANAYVDDRGGLESIYRDLDLICYMVEQTT